MKLKGRILLFDTVNQNNDLFPKDCKIVIPEKVPLTYNFSHAKVIGFAEVTQDDKGLVVTAETSPNSYCDDETLKSIFEEKIGVGGYYMTVKTHESNNLLVVDEARLTEVALVLAPVCDEYFVEIVEEGASCSRCIHKEESSSIVGSTCYMCRRNSKDHRIDWFEEKKGEESE